MFFEQLLNLLELIKLNKNEATLNMGHTTTHSVQHNNSLVCTYTSMINTYNT